MSYQDCVFFHLPLLLMAIFMQLGFKLISRIKTLSTKMVGTKISALCLKPKMITLE